MASTTKPSGNSATSIAQGAHAMNQRYVLKLNMMLTGKRLVSVLDIMDYHHKFLKELFTAEHDLFLNVSDRFAAVSQKLRTDVSPEIEKLFVTAPTDKNAFYYDYQTRRRVWDSIYDRIEGPVGNPYRFANISSHRHVRLDDYVRSLLGDEVEKSLPTNMDACNYGLPKEVRAGASNRYPHRSTTSAAGRVVPGAYANDDIIHSPTAAAAAGARPPVSEVYHSARQGELRRPIKVSKLEQEKQFVSEPYLPQNNPNAIKAFQDEESESDDSDWNGDDKRPSFHKIDCHLCSHFKSINIMVAAARINVARGAVDAHSVAGVPRLAAARVGDFRANMRQMEKSQAVRDRSYDPDDTRNWPQVADLMCDFLDQHKLEHKLARNAVMKNFLRTSFVRGDRDNQYLEDQEGFADKELPLQCLPKEGEPMPDPESVLLNKATEKEKQEYSLDRLDQLDRYVPIHDDLSDIIHLWDSDSDMEEFEELLDVLDDESDYESGDEFDD
ncbi:hypothetical protein F4781DRAFT_440487 [Annulohypoxylon bovei var. microspora]|nr:hypothetical protein F4781DRAFT_440487 [Annulohypoxylon bovei var. microspora]